MMMETHHWWVVPVLIMEWNGYVVLTKNAKRDIAVSTSMNNLC